MTWRCIMMFLAIASLIEIIIVVLVMNGFLTELEPFLSLFIDDGLFTKEELEAMLDGDSDGSSSGSNSDELEPAAERALNQRFVQSVLEYDLATAKSLSKVKSIDVNYGDSGQGHLLYRLCATKKETPEMLKMVDFLLSLPNIDPNDDTSAWSPLKGSVQARNQQCATKLLQHKDIIPMITVVGFNCETVPHILPEIALIIPYDEKVNECYMAHTNVVLSNDKKVVEADAIRQQRIAMQRAREAAAATGRGRPSSSFGRERQRQQQQIRQRQQQHQNTKQQQHNTAAARAAQQKLRQQQQQHDGDLSGSATIHGAAAGGGSGSQEQQKARKPRKMWEVVMDPTEFSSVYTAAWFYVTGIEWDRCADHVKVVMLIVGAHSLLVGWACVTYVGSMHGGGQHHHNPGAAAAAAAANNDDAAAGADNNQPQQDDAAVQPRDNVPNEADQQQQQNAPGVAA